MEAMDIPGLDIINLITLFYYKNDHLRYQIILHLTGERNVLYGEYSNYKEYKVEFENLQAQRKNNFKIQIPENQLAVGVHIRN